MGISLLVESERDLEHFVSLFIYNLSSELSDIARYQFVFFSFCAKHRYQALVSHAEQKLIDFEYGKCIVFTKQKLKLIEDLNYFHFQMAKIFRIINETFAVMVSSSSYKYD